MHIMVDEIATKFIIDDVIDDLLDDAEFCVLNKLI